MRSVRAPSRVLSAALLTVGVLVLAGPTDGGDWPQWRGPRRTGAAGAPFHTTAPVERLVRAWEREIGGGYAGPVVSAERVWVHSRQGGKEVVRALRLGDGKLLWERSYPAPFRQDDDARSHGLGPYSTPALADGRLFTFGVNAVLSAWDAETGELLWRRSSAEEFDPSFPYFGAAASPLVWRDRCFVHLGGHDRGRIDSPAEGAMVALGVSDGRELWRWDGDGPALGASPVIHEIDGRAQLVFKSKKLIVGLDPATGRELWRIPFQVPMDNTIVTPLFLGEWLVTSDYDVGLMAWRIERERAAWRPRQAWRHRNVSLFMSSPVPAGGLLVGFSHLRRGQLFVLDPDDGRVLWRGPARSGEHASLLSWRNEVLVVEEDGTLLLAEVSRAGLRPIRQYRLGQSVVWSHPAIAGDRIVFRDGTRLAVARLGDGGAAPRSHP